MRQPITARSKYEEEPSPAEGETLGGRSKEELGRLYAKRTQVDYELVKRGAYYDHLGSLTVPHVIERALHKAAEEDIASREPQQEAEVILLPVKEQPQEAA